MPVSSTPQIRNVRIPNDGAALLLLFLFFFGAP